ncbi:hypothetical protein ACN469_23120 [Corallococcus terminator]
MVRQLRKARGVRAEDVAIPVVTAPGEVAQQVDFGYVGKLLCPRQKVARKAWVFVLVLAHSRYLVADVVFEQSLPTYGCGCTWTPSSSWAAWWRRWCRTT